MLIVYFRKYKKKGGVGAAPLALPLNLPLHSKLILYKFDVWNFILEMLIASVVFQRTPKITQHVKKLAKDQSPAKAETDETNDVEKTKNEENGPPFLSDSEARQVE